MKSILANNELADKISIITHRPLHGGEQYIFDCGNGFGASVVKHLSSYGGSVGKWELAVLTFNGVGYSIHYDNDVANGDVLGHLDDNEVMDLLIKISKVQYCGLAAASPFLVAIGVIRIV